MFRQLEKAKRYGAAILDGKDPVIARRELKIDILSKSEDTKKALLEIYELTNCKRYINHKSLVFWVKKNKKLLEVLNLYSSKYSFKEGSKLHQKLNSTNWLRSNREVLFLLLPFLTICQNLSF